jgi:hypothetical protein
MRPTAGYSLLGYERNEDVLELTADQVRKKLAQYKQKWFNHVSRMEDIRYPKQLLDYRPIGKRKPRPPLKRPLDGYSRESETGHLLGWLTDQKGKK